MKRLNLIFGAAALAAALMAAPTSADAQDRGPYETNKFGDNWFIGAGGGVNIFWNEGYDVKIAPSVDGYFGKWFTPSVGMRAGYQGLNFNSVKDDNTVKYGYMYVHGDFLWNISNAIGGYKEARFWNFTPYLHAGYFRSYGTDGSDYANNEIAAGAGLLHNLRLTDRLDILIDMKAIVVNGTVHKASGVALLPSVTAGLSVDLGWPGFTRTSDIIGAVEVAAAEQNAILETAIVALEAANAALEAENSSLKKKNNDLNKTVQNMKKAEEPADAPYVEMQPITVYFGIGKSVLDEFELQHLDFYAKNIIDKVNGDPSVEIVVMGSADSNTGTAKRNQYLSEARGKYITDLLSSKYGIDKANVKVKAEVVKAKTQPEMDRAVVISFK